jgi:hypothetical protein
MLSENRPAPHSTTQLTCSSSIKMDSIEELLERLTLTQYLEGFVEAGFDTAAALDCITEVDFEKLGVKLGYRRILQRHQFRRNGGSDKDLIRLPVDSTVSVMAF